MPNASRPGPGGIRKAVDEILDRAHHLEEAIEHEIEHDLDELAKRFKSLWDRLSSRGPMGASSTHPVGKPGHTRTILHRGSIRHPFDSLKKFSHGVTNAQTRKPSQLENRALHDALVVAATWIDAALKALASIGSRIDVQDDFYSSFTTSLEITAIDFNPKSNAVTPVTTVKDHYHSMSKKVKHIDFRVQIPRPQIDGKEHMYADAFSTPEMNTIAVWIDPKGQDGYPIFEQGNPKRAHTLVHELAHVAWGADDIYESMGIKRGITDAERYAVFASKCVQKK